MRVRVAWSIAPSFWMRSLFRQVDTSRAHRAKSTLKISHGSALTNKTLLGHVSSLLHFMLCYRIKTVHNKEEQRTFLNQRFYGAVGCVYSCSVPSCWPFGQRKRRQFSNSEGAVIRRQDMRRITRSKFMVSIHNHD